MQDDFATLSRVMNSRYSCRAYMEKEVPDADIQAVVTAASRVPTWCNAQPWHLIVTKGDATKLFSNALVKAAEDGADGPRF